MSRNLMDAPTGTKVRMWRDLSGSEGWEHVKECLDPEKFYTVSSVQIDNWSSHVILTEFPHRSFNICTLETVEEFEPVSKETARARLTYFQG